MNGEDEEEEEEEEEVENIKYLKNKVTAICTIALLSTKMQVLPFFKVYMMKDSHLTYTMH